MEEDDLSCSQRALLGVTARGVRIQGCQCDRKAVAAHIVAEAGLHNLEPGNTAAIHMIVGSVVEGIVVEERHVEAHHAEEVHRMLAVAVHMAAGKIAELNRKQVAVFGALSRKQVAAFGVLNHKQVAVCGLLSRTRAAGFGEVG